MTDKITEIFGDIDENTYDSFHDKTNSNIKCSKSTRNVSRDFSWIPVVEDSLPYLDNIIRNPKRFLQQEEDIVIVEKSKKISTETVQHLAMHTNFIQDVDDDGMVRPSKVLNIEKEDSWDLYENRFIYTLINELYNFVLQYTDKDLEEPSVEINTSASYEGSTTYNNENVKVSINIESLRNQKPEDFNLSEVKKKIEYIRDVVSDFENSEFIKSMSQAVPVKSPIKKTNIILKDPNFQKALVLWEFIKNSEIGLPQEVKSNVEDLSSKELKDKFDLSFFLDYSSIININSSNASVKSLADKILCLIDEYVDISDYSEKKVMDLITKEITEAINDRKERDNSIKEILKNYINENNNYINELCDIM